MRASSAYPSRQMTTPIDVVKSNRRHGVNNLTSMPAGKTVPIAVIPLLREDRANVGLNLAFQMQETVEILLNGVNIDVHAYFVPRLASERYRSMDDINLSYTGEARPGEDVVPWFELALAGDINEDEIHQRLGKHYKPTDLINMEYVEAYNIIQNHRRTDVSPNIPKRDRLDRTLAQAFWSQNMFSHIVPDFDQAVMEGQVALNIAEQNLALKGTLGDRWAPVNTEGGNLNFNGRDVGMGTASGAAVVNYSGSGVGQQNVNTVSGLKADLQGVVARLADNGITISLANIDMARKAQWFAEIRKRYNGLGEEMLIDLLMDGINIPEQAWKQPMLLHHGRTQFGMAKRYASDGDSLTQSVVNGAAAMSFRFAVPPVPCGGVIMVTAEISPEQMFERQEDPYLHAQGVEDLPAYLPDLLDPEKVEVVPCRYIDVDHDTPDDVYGYAPKNYRWNSAAPNMGGRFHRPAVDAPFDEDRQMFWAVETENPTLSEDAYLVPADIHLKPFYTSTIDPFDVMTRGEALITGNTVFGGLLVEATAVSDYDAVLERVETDRIEKP